jgi:hypothetical protein
MFAYFDVTVGGDFSVFPGSCPRSNYAFLAVVLSTHNDRSFPLPVGITTGNSFDVPSVLRILQYAVTMRHYFVRCSDNQSHSLLLHDRVLDIETFSLPKMLCLFYELCASFLCQAIEACAPTVFADALLNILHFMSSHSLTPHLFDKRASNSAGSRNKVNRCSTDSTTGLPGTHT